MRHTPEYVFDEYLTLSTEDRISFLEKVHQHSKYMYQYATMPESLRRFYSEKER